MAEEVIYELGGNFGQFSTGETSKGDDVFFNRLFSHVNESDACSGNIILQAD